MTTLDLSRDQITIEGLLKLASGGLVRIISQEGQSFVLEKTDDPARRPGLDRNALGELVRKSPPPQEWFDGEEQKPF